MNRFVLISYKNSSLGNYFLQCAAKIEGVLAEQNPNAEIIILKNQNCSQLYLDEKLSQINSDSFLLAAYCHGLEDSFNSSSGTPFVKKGKNDYLFRNGFIFTNSCYSGAMLGPALIENRAELFVGFNDETFVELGYADIFADCDNFPLMLFLLKREFYEEKRAELLKTIKDFYNQQVDKLDHFAAGRLIDNRDSLVIYFSDTESV